MEKKHTSIDIIIPVFNEEQNLQPLVENISSTLGEVFSTLNIMIVDDGSTDNTEDNMQELQETAPNLYVKYIRLSRNHGKDLAIKCGIDHSSADYCAIMDGDFQHHPSKILEAVNKMGEGYHIVNIEKSRYVGAYYRNIGSLFYERTICFLIGERISLTDFKVLDSKAISIIKGIVETDYFNRGIVNLIGLKSAKIYYEPASRNFGKSKYSIASLIGLALDSAISVSVRPLRISVYIGLIISLASLLYGLYIFIEKVFLGQPIEGFATVGTALFFLGGVQLCFLGIIGEYLGRTFMQSKMRPQYLIDYMKDL